MKMSIKWVFKGLLLCVNIICINNCYGQIFFRISKDELKSYGIQEIVNVKKSSKSTSDSKNIDSCETQYFFKRNRLIKINYYQSEGKSSDETYRYYGDSLVICNINGEGGNESHMRRYKYKNRKMITSVTVTSHTNDDGNYASEEEFEDLHKYRYNSSGKLVYYSVLNDNGKHLVETSRRYFLYRKNMLVGYFPSKDQYSNNLSASSDTIYYPSKLTELKRIGLQRFSETYFKGDMGIKVIEDAYQPVRDSQLLINNEPIHVFLSKQGRSNAKYIIVEIFDNEYLFYKLID